MAKGNIFIDKEGINVSNIQVPNRNSVLTDFYKMRERARKNGDSFFCVNSKELEDFYEKVWSPDDSYWEGVEQRFISSIQTDFYTPTLIDDIAQFDVMPEPKTHGGYEYYGHPEIGYVHDINTWKDWHYEWIWNHPESITWENTNGVFPYYDRVIKILTDELEKLQYLVKESETNERGLSYADRQYLKTTNIKSLNSDKVVVDFYRLIMNRKKQDGEKISYAKEIGSIICKANYYHHESELEELEREQGNGNAEMIFSIKKYGKYQFLSIDKRHGMFELCDDKGNHMGEIRFDGSLNGSNTIEVNHRLQCVNEWKNKYNK